MQTLTRKENTSDHQNNLVVQSKDGNIILCHQIKTQDGWVAKVNFLQDTEDGRVQSATAP